jgi:hypothetical protein
MLQANSGYCRQRVRFGNVIRPGVGVTPRPGRTRAAARPAGPAVLSIPVQGGLHHDNRRVS